MNTSSGKRFFIKIDGESSKSNTCCQLFFTEKLFVYVVPMKSNIEVIQSVNQFAKDIESPDAIICDMACEQTS